MKSFINLATFFLMCGLLVLGGAATGYAQTKPDSQPAVQPPVALRDGQHDFDWELGNWTIKISRLQKPLTGSTTWTELNGTVVCRKIWDGKANLAEVFVDTPSGKLEFFALRLYNPKTRQWTNTFSSSDTGTLNGPMYGQFKDGRGEFYDQEEYNGRMILVRFTFVSLSSDLGRSEQSFSADGGKTWEINWINIYTRAKDETAKP
jgi:hypothetical protein